MGAKRMNNIIIEINIDSLKGAGFGGYLMGSIKNEGKAKVIIDLNCMLNCIVDNPEIQFKDFFSETVLHEILHSIEDLFNKTFDEEKIENVLELAREKR